jgi:menaquinone-dependent protoporphyrinogen oxidase
MATVATDKLARVLVVYATRHGATRGIAERIAATLRESGAAVTVQPVGQADSPADYDAVIVGSALYFFRWLKEATGFVRRNSATLAERPVWLFSSGPLGTDTTDAQGRDVRASAGPKELPEFQAAFHPREHRVFFGAFDSQSKPVGLVERVVRLLPAARNAFPVGDFRDWQEIGDWAGSIARALTPVPVAGD